MRWKLTFVDRVHVECAKNGDLRKWNGDVSHENGAKMRHPEFRKMIKYKDGSNILLKV